VPGLRKEQGPGAPFDEDSHKERRSGDIPQNRVMLGNLCQLPRTVGAVKSSAMVDLFDLS
jgi:hypothetical protein